MGKGVLGNREEDVRNWRNRDFSAAPEKCEGRREAGSGLRGGGGGGSGMRSLARGMGCTAGTQPP